MPLYRRCIIHHYLLMLNKTYAVMHDSNDTPIAFFLGHVYPAYSSA